MDLKVRQARHSGMAFFVIIMLAAVIILAGIARPVLAQDHPSAFFQYPDTFLIKPAVCGLGSVAAAAVGDFNGDGKLDTVSICGWEIDVALGNGDGTFQQPIVNLFSLPGGYGSFAITLGDFNGDGKLDVAVWGNSPSGVALSIFLGDGAGNLSYNATYNAPNSGNCWVVYPNSIYVADFNGDGKLDIAALGKWCSTYDSWAYIFLGNGDGTFQSGVPYSTVDPNHPSDYNVIGMAVGDLNGDGKPDIAVTESNGMAVLLNNGNGKFGTATYYDNGVTGSEIGIAIGDVNGDKMNDIVTTAQYGYVFLYLNQGSGKFALKGSIGQTDPQAFQGSWLVNIADINGDKKQDLVVTDAAGEIWVFYGKGDGTFTAGPIYPLQKPQDAAPSNVVLADFNGDGALDIFIGGNDGWLGEVAPGRSDGTFQTNAAYGWNDNGFGLNLVTADFNGDGFPDVAYSGATDTATRTQPGFELMAGSSHGVLANPVFVPVASSGGGITEWIATGDVNGDGKADIVATIGNNTQYNQVAVLTGKGNGKFNNPVYYSTGSTVQAYDVFLVDVNGDGKPDIVVSNQDGTISVLLNNGKGAFGTANLITSIASYNSHLNSLAFGDFNGDGKLDIAVSPNWRYNSGSVPGTVYILPGNGDGTFQAPIIDTFSQTYVYAVTLAAGDFNKDGKLDLFVTLAGNVGCPNTEGYVALLGKGDGTFTTGAVTCAGNNDYHSSTPVYPVVADFNGDGNLDVFVPLLQQGWGAGPWLLQGKGGGSFTPLAGYDVPVQGGGQEWLGSGFYVGQASYGAAVADFNGDGTPDIAVLNNSSYYNVDYISFVTVMFNSTQAMSVSPLNVNFGTVSVGSHKAGTVNLTNNQTKPLTFTGYKWGGADPGDFRATSNCKSTMKAGWECTVNVTFTPAATGTRTATLSIHDSVGTQVIQLAGTGK